MVSIFNRLASRSPLPSAQEAVPPSTAQRADSAPATAGSGSASTGPGAHSGRAFGTRLVQQMRRLNGSGARADSASLRPPSVKSTSAESALKFNVAEAAPVQVAAADMHTVMNPAPELVAAGESAAHPAGTLDVTLHVAAVTVTGAQEGAAKPAASAPVAASNAAKAAKLRGELKKLQDWESAHPIDKEKIVAALKMANEAHETKKPWDIRNKNYTKACELMRQGMGIDDETYARAQKTFALQGIADAYDSGVFSFLLAPALAAVAGPVGAELGAAAAKVLKYATQWAISPLVNSVFQIPVDAYIETAARHEGGPVPAPEIASSPKMNKLAKDVKAQVEKANALIAIHEDVSLPAARRNQALDDLKECAAELDALHLGYTARVVLGQSNFIKFSTQIPWRIATAPGPVAATVFGGPVAGAAAAAAQQLTIAPFAAMDEIILKQHVLRFNTKYADVFTDQALGAGKSRRSADLAVGDIDEAKVRKLWTRPAQVVDANVQLVYTDELATRMRRQTKLDKAAEGRTGLTGKGLDKAVARADTAQAELVRLVDDVIKFRDRQWDQLDPEGTIAGMLLSPTKQIAALSKAKFRRPGEFTAQVLDRMGGQALPRTVLGIGGDASNLAHQDFGGHGAAIADNGLAQSAALGSSLYTNPIAKFTKQRVVRGNLMPTSVAIPETPADGGPRAPIMRRSFRKERAVTEGVFQPKMSFGPEDNPLIVDFTQTRAWMNHTNSSAKIITQGTADAAKSLGTHLKATVTMPVRSVAGARADHQAKQARARIARLMPVAEPAPTPTPTPAPTAPVAPPAPDRTLDSLIFERDGSEAIRAQGSARAGTTTAPTPASAPSPGTRRTPDSLIFERDGPEALRAQASAGAGAATAPTPASAPSPGTRRTPDSLIFERDGPEALRAQASARAAGPTGIARPMPATATATATSPAARRTPDSLIFERDGPEAIRAQASAASRIARPTRQAPQAPTPPVSTRPETAAPVTPAAPARSLESMIFERDGPEAIRAQESARAGGAAATDTPR